jgi:uncharacterized membrane protein
MNRTLIKFLVIVSVFCFLPSLIYAQERSYQYNKIVTLISINTDSTIDITEEQTYDFTGEYHQGWRSIPHTGFGSLSNISVIDTETGKSFEYSRKSLDKTDPNSWGKYTVFEQDGRTVIEWYYNAKDESKTWTLSYKVHGAIGFYEDFDEIYWNVFTDYDVPVLSAEVYVTLPPGDYSVDSVQGSLYQETQQGLQTFEIRDDKTAYFYAEFFDPQEDFTIAVGWPKGIVKISAYWIDLLKVYYVYALGVLLVLGGTILLLIRWYVLEYRPFKSKTIIVEYEPPQGFTPAMTYIVSHESLSAKTWPATIIHLAVHKYISIEEKEDLRWWKKLMGQSKEYILTRLPKDASTLEEFEKRFLVALFISGDVLSLKELSKDIYRKKVLMSEMKEIEQEIYAEVSKDHAHLYTVQVEKKNNIGIIMVIIFVLGFITLILKDNIQLGHTFFGIVLIIIFGLLFYSQIFYNPRLSQEGNDMKRRILGFKHYLEVADKYRLQNLTPDIFEAYLPYAMIFGVEKKWSKSFETITVNPPEWYGHTIIGGSSIGISNNSFSPSLFSTSFVSSFSTAFASSGASGASGGGGGAGGGGGGGGGGAS